MKTTDLVLHREQLLNDIRNTAYIIARSLSEKQGEVAADITWLTDICEDGNVERVTRILNLESRALEGRLHRLSAIPAAGHTYLDDTYGEPPQYHLHLTTPNDFTKNSIYLVKNLVHEILVYRTIFEWCGLTHHLEGMDWLREKIDDLYESLRQSINRHPGYVLRKANPLGF